MMKRYHLFIVFFMLVLCINGQDIGFGVPAHIEQSVKCLSEHDRQEILKILQAHKSNSKRLTNEEIYFEWPVRQAVNFDEWGSTGISNFVDLDSNYPNQLQDYNCGQRTYDTESGYNHKGTDIFSWPFAWKKMDSDHLEVVAAAPGVIIYKQEAYNDKSCSFNSNSWNAIYVEHYDGSVAWYGHLKRNSLTDKQVGDKVELGEFLGIMGSSGNSTGPHLHFEVYDSEGSLIDPFYGSCNLTTDRSWWQDQETYFSSGINALHVHSQEPSFGCYSDEIYNVEVNIRSGNVAYFATYFRDQMQGDESFHRLIAPSDDVYRSWTSSSSQYYSASYWWRSHAMPTSSEYMGEWVFEVDYGGETRSTKFYLYDGNPDSKLSVSVDTLFFDVVQVGETAQTTFTLSSLGEDGVMIESISAEEPFNGSWYGKMNSNSEKEVELSFTPQEDDVFISVLEIQTSALGDTEVVLYGRTPVDIQRILSIPQDLDFSVVDVGKSIIKEVVISNSGNRDLQIFNIPYPVGFTGDTELIVSAGSESVMEVIFEPLEDLDYEGEMIIESNATEGSNSMLLSGSGRPILFSEKKETVLYPNPNKNRSLKFRSESKIQKLRIMNLSGEEILFIENPSDEISLREIISGLYIVELITKSGFKFERLILN